jgi:hypothetical protein
MTQMSGIEVITLFVIAGAFWSMLPVISAFVFSRLSSMKTPRPQVVSPYAIHVRRRRLSMTEPEPKPENESGEQLRMLVCYRIELRMWDGAWVWSSDFPDRYSALHAERIVKTHRALVYRMVLCE